MFLLSPWDWSRSRTGTGSGSSRAARLTCVGSKLETVRFRQAYGTKPFEIQPLKHIPKSIQSVFIGVAHSYTTKAHWKIQTSRIRWTIYSLSATVTRCACLADTACFLCEPTGNQISSPNRIGGARDGEGGVVVEERAVVELWAVRGGDGWRISVGALDRG
jgi:hypothetical protein